MKKSKYIEIITEHRATGHPEGQHVAEGDALHPGLQQGNFGQHFVLQRGRV